jgi:triacylglycerol lipase
MNVVLVHGFANTGGLFGPLRRRLESEGHSCHAPTLHPRDGRLGIPDLSGKLARYIEAAVGPAAPVALVGFSMGALVARHYLQALGGAARTRAFFSIAGPHRGTFSAYLYPGLGTRQMRPGSPFLRLLESGASELGALPVFTYWTPFDLMIRPSASIRMDCATETRVWCPLHALLPVFPRVGLHIAGELRSLEAPASAPKP